MAILGEEAQLLNVSDSIQGGLQFIFPLVSAYKVFIRQRQTDRHHKFEASLNYLLSSCLSKAIELVSKKK